MDLFGIALAAFLTAGLTFFSGFGLSTLLLPLLALIFPLPDAIGITAVVHLLNNLFKLALTGHQAHPKTVLQFGIPAAAAAFLGARCLNLFADLEPLFTYPIAGHQAKVSWLGLLMSVLIWIFAAQEGAPEKMDGDLKRPWSSPLLGGLLSGFFGGLSGHQGALRSAFLTRTALTKEQFVGTGAMIACFVDLTRLMVYTSRDTASLTEANLPLLLAAILGAFTGSWTGNRWLRKVTLSFIRRTVQWLLSGIALGLALGWLAL